MIGNCQSCAFLPRFFFWQTKQPRGKGLLCYSGEVWKLAWWADLGIFKDRITTMRVLASFRFFVQTLGSTVDEPFPWATPTGRVPIGRQRLLHVNSFLPSFLCSTYSLSNTHLITPFNHQRFSQSAVQEIMYILKQSYVKYMLYICFCLAECKSRNSFYLRQKIFF